MKTRRLKNKSGFSLVEVLVYMVIFAVVISVLVVTMITLSRTYRQVTASRILESSAVLTLDRIAEIVRSAQSVNLGDSILSSNLGALSLDARSADGTSYTARIYVQDRLVRLVKDGVFEGQLTSSSTSVDNLFFYHIETPVSEAVRIELTMTASSSNYSKTETFYMTTILRNSY